MSATERPWPEGGLFARLRASCPADWRRYTEHDFVRQLARGTLPEASFRHYLGQDYLFLIQFARAYALAIYKSSSLADMREALGGVKTILENEMLLHVRYCQSWGLAEADIERITGIWKECLATYGGPFLFGKRTMADAMYAPVATRFVTYDVKLDPSSSRYRDTVMAMPEMVEWIAAARQEADEIEELDAEF